MTGESETQRSQVLFHNPKSWHMTELRFEQHSDYTPHLIFSFLPSPINHQVFLLYYRVAYDFIHFSISVAVKIASETHVSFLTQIISVPHPQWFNCPSTFFPTVTPIQKERKKKSKTQVCKWNLFSQKFSMTSHYFVTGFERFGD